MGFLFCHWDRVKLIATNAWIYDIRRYMEITTIIDNQLLSVGVFCIVINTIGITKNHDINLYCRSQPV
mgnify:CR=1 FL=1